MTPQEIAERVEAHASRFIQAILTRNGLDGFPMDRSKGVEMAVELAKELVDQVNRRFR